MLTNDESDSRTGTIVSTILVGVIGVLLVVDGLRSSGTWGMIQTVAGAGLLVGLVWQAVRWWRSRQRT